MLAAVCARISPDDPLAGLDVREIPEPSAAEGWEVVEVRAAALNHHDVWTLRGVGVTEDDLPVVLGDGRLRCHRRRTGGGRSRRPRQRRVR